MANPLKIFTVLTASQAVKFEQGVDVNNAKVTGLANGVASSDAVAYGQLTDLSGAVKSYVDSADSVLQGNIDAASGALKTYADGLDSAQTSAREALSSSMKSYVDAQDLIYSGAFDARLDTNEAAFITFSTVTVPAMSSSISGTFTAKDAAQTAARLALSGALKTYIDQQDTADAIAWAAADSSLSGTLKTYIDQRDNAVSGALKTYADQLDSAQTSARTDLSSSVSSSIEAEAAARAAEDVTLLKLDGTRAMTGDLDMGNKDIVNAKSGSFSGDVTVDGNLQVNGALTYVNTTNLDVTDKLVTLAKGAANAAAADGGGIELEGAGASLTYVDASTAWKFNKDLQVSGNLKVDGRYVRLGSGNSAAFEDREDVRGVSEMLEIAPGYNTASLAATDVVVASGGDGYGLWIGAEYNSSASFTNIVTPIVSRAGHNTFNVAEAIHDIDAKLGQLDSGNDNIKTAYNALRQVVTGTLSSGTALLTLAGAQFAAGEIDNLALDVMIDVDNTGYTNDLVAIKMFVDGAAVKVQIDAPGAASAKYRLIVVNEKDGGLAVI